MQASIEMIEKIYPHSNADALELAKVLGYQCVIAKNSLRENEMVVYIQPDSVLPSDREWAKEFLKYAPTRVKAIKLRGEWSEGLIIPLKYLATEIDNNIKMRVGLEVSEILGITHYESSSESKMVLRPEEGIIGTLPEMIPKTDEERWENLRRKLDDYYGRKVDVTLKVDGQSLTVFYMLKNDEFGITGRKMRFDTSFKNNYTSHIEKYDLENKLREYSKKHQISICLRGESYGKNIQKNSNNPHSKMELGLVFFSVYLIDERRYAGKGEPHYYVNVCNELQLPMVDIVERDVELTKEMITKYSSELKKVNNQPFEGVVIKGDDFSFKIINKHYDSNK